MSKFRNYDNYEIYADGRIWSYRKKKFLKPSTDTSGYQQVKLYDKEGKPKLYLLHRIVYEAVSGSPITEDMQINHRSEVKTENFFENLELVTQKQNINYGSRNERARKSLTNNQKISKAVGAFQNGKIVMTFQSTQEAGRQGFCQSSVSDCCRGKLKTHKGFEWRYI